MIPTSYPHSAVTRTSDPYRRKRIEARRMRSGRVKQYAIARWHVDVRCACGREYPMLLRNWMQRPMHCVSCSPREVRERDEFGRFLMKEPGVMNARDASG